MTEYQDLFAELAIVSPAIVLVLGAIWAVSVCRLSKRMIITISVAFVLAFVLSTVVCRIPWVRDALYDHSGYE
jgi:hypothetical protein